MNLLTHIKREREQQRKKQTIRQDIFNHVNGLVRQCGLQENFLDLLDKVEDYLSAKNIRLTRIRVKDPVERPLFSLATKDEYFITMSIIKKVDNPYLKFAHSPQEILLCKPLYLLNPSMDSEKLIRYHFETLYLHERTKIKNTET